MTLAEDQVLLTPRLASTASKQKQFIGRFNILLPVNIRISSYFLEVIILKILVFIIIDMLFQYCEPVSPISRLNIKPTASARSSVPSDAALPPGIASCRTPEEH